MFLKQPSGRSGGRGKGGWSASSPAPLPSETRTISPGCSRSPSARWSCRGSRGCPTATGRDAASCALRRKGGRRDSPRPHPAAVLPVAGAEPAAKWWTEPPPPATAGKVLTLNPPPKVWVSGLESADLREDVILGSSASPPPPPASNRPTPASSWEPSRACRPKTSRGTAFPTPSPASSTGPLKMKAAEITPVLSDRADHATSPRS